MNRFTTAWLLALSLPLCCGCGMLNFATRPAAPLAPVAFSGTPTLPQVVEAVNANTQRINSLHSDTAAVSTPGFPALRATLDVERPRRLRLRAKLFGPELDLGSNDEVFWFWLKSSGQPSVLFARHDQYAQSPAMQTLPIEPGWVIEALGLVMLEPNVPHEGPFQRSDGKIEVRSQIFGSTGPVARTLVIDPTYGWIVEQQITDMNNRLLASAVATNHRYYPEHGVSLPHRVEVQAPAANLTFQIEISQYVLNRPEENPLETWGLPDLTGQPPINLSNLGAGPGAPSAAGASYGQPVSPNYPTDPRTGFRPEYRGYSQRR